VPEIRTDDDRYLLAVQGDGNAVVYDRGTPIWDRWSYEARQPAPDPLEQPEPPRQQPSGAPRVIRVTNGSDGEFVNRMYSYWPNAVVLNGDVYVFAGHVDGRPRFFRVDLSDGRVTRLGSLLPYGGEAEGWYWDREGWVYLCDGPRLRRVNPFTGKDVVVFDITETHPGCRLSQSHSSDDGKTHSATVQRIVDDGPYPNIGTVAFHRGEQVFFPTERFLDESAITTEGVVFLIIKEYDKDANGDPINEDNRIINLETRETRLLLDADGAVGHSDCGPGFVVGEDNIHGACVYWDLRQPLSAARRRTLFETWGMGHVSIRGGRCLLSNDTHLSLVALDGSGVTRLLAHGMIGAGYDYQVRASLDPTGAVACYMTNAGGHLDVFLLLL
jgi:hypothetical protein